MRQKYKRHPLIMGTVILTVTGLISRVIGFFYRIYLSRLFGEEGMGIYQLLSPVLSLSFSLTAAAYQTAISKFVAERTARERRSSFQPMFVGLSISLPLSLICCFAVYMLSDFIAVSLLLEGRTASMLRILAFSIPLGAVHACINGYFYGRKKTGIPAASQLFEQLARVGCVYGVSLYAFSKGSAPTINIAVLGLVFGEFVSMLISVIAIYYCYAREHFLHNSFIPLSNGQHYAAADGIKSSNRQPGRLPHAGNFTRKRQKLLPVYGSILSMALPLTANRIVLNLLQSLESVSIPAKLRAYGYDTGTALSVYGVLTGMAMPLIFFPNALTSSVSVLLLPIISENYALGDMKAVKSAIGRTVKFCTLLGLVCMSGFGFLGNWAGETLFNSSLAGYFITTLGFICPFIYLDTTLSSILQGLGMAGHIFVMNVICLLIRLAFIFTAVPMVGIGGYLWGLLISQVVLSILYLSCLYSFCRRH